MVRPRPTTGRRWPIPDEFASRLWGAPKRPEGQLHAAPQRERKTGHRERNQELQAAIRTEAACLAGVGRGRRLDGARTQGRIEAAELGDIGRRGTRTGIRREHHALTIPRSARGRHRPPARPPVGPAHVGKPEDVPDLVDQHGSSGTDHFSRAGEVTPSAVSWNATAFSSTSASSGRCDDPTGKCWSWPSRGADTSTTARTCRCGTSSWHGTRPGSSRRAPRATRPAARPRPTSRRRVLTGSSRHPRPAGRLHESIDRPARREIVRARRDDDGPEHGGLVPGRSCRPRRSSGRPLPD